MHMMCPKTGQKISLKFKTIDERIDSMLPKNRGDAISPGFPEDEQKISSLGQWMMAVAVIHFLIGGRTRPRGSVPAS